MAELSGIWQIPVSKFARIAYNDGGPTLNLNEYRRVSIAPYFSCRDRRESHATPGNRSVTARSQPPATQAPSPVFSAAAIRAVLVALAGGAGLFLAWMAADTLLLIFAGLLFAALLDACTRGLSKLLPIGHGWSLAIVSLAFAIVTAGLLVWSGYSIARQITDLLDALNHQLHSLERGMAKLGVATASESASTSSIGDLLRFLFLIRISFSARRKAHSPWP